MKMLSKKSAVILVLFCALITATAQVLWKIVSSYLEFNILSLITNFHFILGCILYAIGLVLLLIALKSAELNLLYPLFASSYLWTVLISYFFLSESLTTSKILGIILITSGVAFIGSEAR